MAVNREIVFVLRMQNEATAAIRSLMADLRTLQQSTNGSTSAGGGGGNSQRAMSQASAILTAERVAAIQLASTTQATTMQERSAEVITASQARTAATVQSMADRAAAQVSTQTARTATLNAATALNTQSLVDTRQQKTAASMAATALKAAADAGAVATKSAATAASTQTTAAARAAAITAKAQADTDATALRSQAWAARISAGTPPPRVGAIGSVANGAGGGGGGGFLSSIFGGSSSGTNAEEGGLGGILGGLAGFLVKATAAYQVAKRLGEGLVYVMEKGDEANRGIAMLGATLGRGRDNAVAVYNALEKGAQQSGMATEALTHSFVQFNIALKGTGTSTSQVVEFTKVLEKLSVISGTSSARTQMAFMQIAEGMSIGTLQGQHFRALAGDMPAAIELIATGLGKTNGELREMGHAGKLTGEALIEGVLKGAASVEDKYNAMPVTIQRATASMSTSFAQLAHVIDDKFSLSSTAAKVMQWMSDKAQAISETLAKSADDIARADARNVMREQPVLPVGRETSLVGPAPSMNDLRNNLPAARAHFAAQKKLAEDYAAQMAQDILLAAGMNAAQDNLARSQAQAATVVKNLEKVTDELGYTNKHTKDDIATLQKVVDAGPEAFRLYGFTAYQASQAIAAITGAATPAARELARLHDAMDLAMAGNISPFEEKVEAAFKAKYPKGFSAADADAMAKARTQVAEETRALINVTGQHDREVKRQRDVELANIRVTSSRNPNDRGMAAALRQSEYARQDAISNGMYPGEADKDKIARDAVLRANNQASMASGARAVSNAMEEQRLKTKEATDALGAYVAEGGTASAEARIQAEAQLKAFKDTKDGKGNLAAVTKVYIDLMTQEATAKGNLEALKTIDRNKDEIADLEDEIALRNLSVGARERELVVMRQQHALERAGKLMDPQVKEDLANSTRNMLNAKAQNTFDEAGMTRRAGWSEEILMVGKVGYELEQAKLRVDLQALAQKRLNSLTEEEWQLNLKALKAKQAARDAINADPIQGMKNGLASVAQTNADVLQGMQQATERAFSGMTDAIVNFAATGKANFKDFALSVIKDLIKIAVQSAITGPLAKAAGTMLGNIFPGSSMGEGTIFGQPSSLYPAPHAHSGGFGGGQATFYRDLPIGTFNNAPRFHTGGIPGLAGNEHAVIVKGDEAIMPTVRLPDGTLGIRSIGGGRGGAVFAPQVSILVDAKGSQASPADHQKMANEMTRQLDMALTAKMAEFTREQRREGGMLNPARSY